MNTKTISIEIPSDLFVGLGENEQLLQKQLKMQFVLNLYLNEQISIGKASQIVDLSRLEFESYLSKNKIPISLYGIEEINSDIEKFN